MIRKMTAALGAACLVGVGLITVAAPANAADGEQFIVNGDFSTPTINGLLNTPNTTTDFALGDGTLGYGPDNGSMYDPGRYIIASNPASVHEAWITLPEGNPMLILNGFQNTNQIVWEQTIQTSPCTTPGSVVTFDFSATAMNILRADYNGGNNGGANISVTINGQPLGLGQDLTSNLGVPVNFVGSVAAASSFDVAIWNNGTAYTGNDFAIDNISLVQRGECAPPCTDTVHGVWWNYTGNSATMPAANDPKWHALPATPGGQHDVGLRGFDAPYQVGAAKGKGDWFRWTDDGTKCTR